jgi:hypothetical protein
MCRPSSIGAIHGDPAGPSPDRNDGCRSFIQVSGLLLRAKGSGASKISLAFFPRPLGALSNNNRGASVPSVLQEEMKQMFSAIRKHLNPATVIATVALVVAMTGEAFAVLCGLSPSTENFVTTGGLS